MRCKAVSHFFSRIFSNFFKKRKNRPAGPLSAEGCFWLRADPVLLEADHQRVFMRGCVGRHLEESKRIELFQKLNQLLIQDNLELIYLGPIEWVIKSPIDPKIATYSVAQCLNQDIRVFLPSGENQAYWQRLLTECQMIMRDYEREYSMNSLWFWGEGLSL